MPHIQIAQETVAIAERGWYESPGGGQVSIAKAVKSAKGGTHLYRPQDLAELPWPTRFASASPCKIEVTPETTGAAARRLVVEESVLQVALLNFASAKHPGGGFLRGSKAQEEDLARCSALYACQLTQPAYYEANRASESLLYTDHLIYSPEVPFFRDERLELLPVPFTVSVITSPAPNAGEELKRRPDAAPQITETLERRAEQILRVAAQRGHRTLILGAWGCGVFKNDPAEVAQVCARLLGRPNVRGAFDRVVFAIYDRTKTQSTLRAFEERFRVASTGS